MSAAPNGASADGARTNGATPVQVKAGRPREGRPFHAPAGGGGGDEVKEVGEREGGTTLGAAIAGKTGVLH